MLELLIVDDDAVLRGLLEEVFAADGYRVSTAGSCAEARARALALQPALLLTDIRLAEDSAADGFTLLREVRALSPDTVTVLMTGFGSLEGALEAVREGAFDYISKPFRMEELRALIARAGRHRETLLAAQRGGGAAPPRAPRPSRAGTLIGSSPAMVAVYRALAHAAPGRAPLVLAGEPGTGRESVARALHEKSGARGEFRVLDAPFRRETAGTGAPAGGTLFLTELLEQGPFEQLELAREIADPSSRWRIVAATTAPDLPEAVRAGRLKEELFYALKPGLVAIPPLRERGGGDLGEWIDACLATASERAGREISHFSPEALAALGAYAWPGNVRELRAVVEHAVLRARSPVLEPEDLPPEVRGRPEAAAAGGGGTTAPGLATLEMLEREHIQRVLEETGFNKSRAAEILGIDRGTLYRKAQRFGLRMGG